MTKFSDTRHSTVALTTLILAELANGTKGHHLFGDLGRIKQTAQTTYYVRTDGNDANNGSANTSVGAFLTLQGAYDYICRYVDCAGFRAIIKLADGTYTGTLLTRGKAPVGGAITIEGNTVSRTSVVLAAATDTNCIEHYASGSLLFVHGVTFKPAANYDSFRVGAAAPFNFTNVAFDVTNSPRCVIGYAQSKAAVSWQDPYYEDFGSSEVIGPEGPTSVGYFWISVLGASFEADHQLDIKCDITVTEHAWLVSEGNAQADVPYTQDAASTGTVTGSRYLVNGNGVLNTFGSGDSYVPGSVAGTTATGGQVL